MCLTRNPLFVGFTSVISYIALRSFERSLSCRFIRKGTKNLETTVICIRKSPGEDRHSTAAASIYIIIIIIHFEGSSINLIMIPAKDIGWKIGWKEKKKPEEFGKFL
jgi:hypothetical protein